MSGSEYSTAAANHHTSVSGEWSIGNVSAEAPAMPPRFMLHCELSVLVAPAPPVDPVAPPIAVPPSDLL